MTNIVSAADARTQFGQLLRRVKQNRERFVIDRRGEPQAVIMSLDDYLDTIAPEPDWLRKVGEASRRRGTDRLPLRQLNVEINASRRPRKLRVR